MALSNTHTDVFEANRQFLTGLAYRLVGQYTEAEDLVQDAYIRWHQSSEKQPIQHPRAFLSRTITRLCLDYLKSARVKREEYVGPWLPEPVLESQVQPIYSDNGILSFEDMPDLSYALMLTLERLSALERAVFILHDIFAISFPEIAETFEKSESSCRQLAVRARKHLQEKKRRFPSSKEALTQLTNSFVQALTTHNTDTLRNLFTEDAVFKSDGGGVVVAAGRPIFGADNIAQFFAGIFEKYPFPENVKMSIIDLNGTPALINTQGTQILQVYLFELDDTGHIQELNVMRNPNKLLHLVSAI